MSAFGKVQVSALKKCGVQDGAESDESGRGETLGGDRSGIDGGNGKN